MAPHLYRGDAGAALVDQLRGLGQRVTRAANRRLAALGLSYSRARILTCLARTGPMLATDLARTFGQAPRTITEAIDGLERDGFVIRGADPADRRARRLTITAAGRAASRHAADAGAAFGGEIAAALGADDLARLTSLLHRIERHLAAGEQVAGFAAEPAKARAGR